MATFEPATLQALLQPQSNVPDQSMMADALRQKEQLGTLAQLTGNQAVQPFAHTILKGVADEREQAATNEQRGAQRQMSLAQMVESARKDALDNNRQERALQNTIQHDRWNEAHPQQIIIPGEGGTQYGVASRAGVPTAPTLQVDATGKPILKGASPAESASQDRLKNDILEKLGTSLDTNAARAGVLKERQGSMDAADRIDALMDSSSGPMTPQKVEELTMLQAKLAAGGATPTESQVKGMMPKTFKGDVANWYQFATGHPADAGVKEFMDIGRTTSENEKAVAQAQITRALLHKLSEHPMAREKYPEDFTRMANEAGLEGLYDPKTGTAKLDINPALEARAVHDPEIKAARQWLRDTKNSKDVKPELRDQVRASLLKRGLTP